LLLILTPLSEANAQQPGKLYLSSVLTQDPPLASRSQSTDFFPGKSDVRRAYNTQLVATGLLIFSDDSGIYKTLQGSRQNKSLTDLGNDFNHLGDLTYVAPALGLVYLSGGRGNRRLAWQAGVAVIKAGIIGVIAKEAVGRKRPNGRDGGNDVSFKPFSLSGDNYQSFPSGHSLVAFSVATVWAHDRPNEKFVAFGLAAAVGLSRIYTHAHWPGDVFWGAVLGVSQARQVLRGNTNLFTIQF
jgi:undecaprenyl-diphosphatase